MSLFMLPGKGPLLKAAEEMEGGSEAAAIYDSEWNLVWASSELREVLGSPLEKDLGIGKNVIELAQKPPWSGVIAANSMDAIVKQSIPYYIYDCGLEKILEILPEEAHEKIKSIEPRRAPDVWLMNLDLVQGSLPPLPITALTSRFKEGDFSGWLRVFGPSMKASVLSLVARGDEGMFERMSRLVEPGRHPVAIMFCDLEDSTSLARRLPSSVYFDFLSTMAKAIDDVVVSKQGVIGKHVGDGASAYFLEEDGPSNAVRAAIEADKEIRSRIENLAREMSSATGLSIPARMRVGLHWGATVYLGQIISGGRLEVTALGEEVNVASRLEAAARGGQTFASKHLLERLDPEDALLMGIDLKSTSYSLAKELGLSKSLEKDLSGIPIAVLNKD